MALAINLSILSGPIFFSIYGNTLPINSISSLQPGLKVQFNARLPFTFTHFSRTRKIRPNI